MIELAKTEEVAFLVVGDVFWFVFLCFVTEFALIM